MDRKTSSNSPSIRRSFQRVPELLSGDELLGAEKLTKRELNRNPESWEAIAAKADIYYFKERYEDALKCCDRSLSINSKNAFTWNTKGNTLYKLGRIEEALECYSKAIEAEPLFESAWYNKKLALEALLKEAKKSSI